MCNEVSDDFLICLYREKNQMAIDMLFDRYKRFIYGFINEMLKNQYIYFDYDDVYQDLVIVFMNCIERYDDECGCFYVFVKKSIERKLIDKINKYKRYNSVVSLDDEMYDGSNETVLDYVCENAGNDTYLYEDLLQYLDEKDKMIVDLKIEGYTYEEMAKILGIGKQSVYRRFNKIRNILKDIIEKID